MQPFVVADDALAQVEEAAGYCQQEQQAEDEDFYR